MSKILNYKASLDNLAKIITIFVLIIIATIAYMSIKALVISEGDVRVISIHSVILLFLFAILGFCYFIGPQSYTIENGSLNIVKYAGNKKIKLSDIVEIRTITDGELTNIIRTFGVGGLFGYYGKYYSSNIGNITFYATQKRNKVFILTKQGDKIIITPDDLGIIEHIGNY